MHGNVTKSTIATVPPWFALVLPFLLVLAPGVWRRRESIRFRLRVVIVAEAAYLLVTLCLTQAGWSGPQAVVCGVFAGLVVGLLQRGRTRYIPRSERRKAIARFEYKTGRKYNPRVHDLDHVVPFSRGGNSTADNLRVIERRTNRAKGSRSPWWDLLGR